MADWEAPLSLLLLLLRAVAMDTATAVTADFFFEDEEVAFVRLSILLQPGRRYVEERVRFFCAWAFASRYRRRLSTWA